MNNFYDFYMGFMVLLFAMESCFYTIYVLQYLGIIHGLKMLHVGFIVHIGPLIYILVYVFR